MSTTGAKKTTFMYDDQLPSLSVPDLEKTLFKYLESTRPFVTPIEYLNTERVVNQFKNGVGQKLDFYLRDRAAKERNWLEQYWLDYAYLEWRLPIAPFINTTGFVVGSDDVDLPELPPVLVDTDIQLANLSMQIHYYMRFFHELREETYPPQVSRSSTFSMDQFRNLFNACRIPQVDKDRLDLHFKTVREGDCPDHLLVMYKYRFFKLNIHHNNILLSITEFYNQLKSIVKRYSAKPYGVGIGALTADYRDNWAKNRQYLMNLSKRNQKNLDLIEKSIMVLNLDDCVALNNDQLGLVGLCGEAKNRYFDKSFQSIATKNGKLTSNVEHSPFDGMVSTTMVNYFLIERRKHKLDLTMVETFEARSGLEEPEELEFDFDSRIEQEIQKSCEIYEKFCKTIEDKVHKIKNSSKDVIKTFNINPDTFTQVCMQLAYYKAHNKPAPTYETATTRSFFHGRTETVRSCTNEATEFCRQMCIEDPEKRLNDSELLELFKKACKKHDTLMSEARENSGCDRHLLGLRMISRELKLDLPEIFTDPAWKKSGGDGNFIISSSCIGFTNSLGLCAAMCENGYLMIYCFSDEGIVFALTRYTTSKETDLNLICKCLDYAFSSVQNLFKTNSKL